MKYRNSFLLRFSLSIIAFLLIVTSAIAAPVVHKLPNGMTVIIDEMHSAPVASVRFYVRAGSVFEDKFLGAGITHYLEHLVGHASLTRSAEETDTLTEAMGNQTNAYTTYSHTCYYMVSAARNVVPMIEMIGDYVFNPLLDANEVDIQKGVILREMAMGEDDPGRALGELLDQTMFQVHPSRYRIIGYPERFKQVSRDDLVSYHKRMYTTDNVVAVVVGDFASKDVLDALTRTLQNVPQTGTYFPSLPSEPAQTSTRRAEEIDENLAQSYMAIGYRTIDLFHPDLYALDLLAYIASAGPSSRLVSELREKQALVDNISAWSDTPVYDAGCFGITSTFNDKTPTQVEAAIIAQLNRFKTEVVSAEELLRAKKQKAAELVYASSGVEAWASTLGSDFLSTGDVNFSKNYVAKIQQVTADDLMRVAKKYFIPSGLTVVTRHNGQHAAAPATTQAPATSTISQTIRTKLPNDATFLSLQDNRAPMVSVQACFLGGLRYETAETAGIGQMLASMLTRGTTTRSREQIAAALDNVGASLNATSGRNSFIVSGQCLVEDVHLLLGLMSDIMQHPSFPENELNRSKAMTLAAIKAQADDADTVVQRLLLETRFPDHPYGLNSLGTEQSVPTFNRQSLAAQQAQIIVPGRMVLSLYGDLSPDRAQRLAQHYFGNWQATIPAQPSVAPQVFPDHPLRASAIREQQQGMYFMAFPGQRINNPDRFALDVLDAAFSGINLPGGRLHAKLRGDQLVYGTHMVPVAGLDPGFVLLYAATEPDKLDLVEKIINDLITDVQTNLMPAQELEKAKSMCIAAHEVDLGDTGSRMMQEALDELYGVGYKSTLSYGQNIDTVTAEQVREGARTYLNLQQAAVAITKPE